MSSRQPLAGPFYTVEQCSSAEAVAKILTVLYPDVRTVLDVTYGSGAFWRGLVDVEVVGMDLDPTRARHVQGDFTRLPFRDHSVDVVVFDPPYQTDVGRGKPSIMSARFGSAPTLDELRSYVSAGCVEAMRVARLGAIIKVQDYIHASTFVEMTWWVRFAIGQPPYQRMDVVRPRKIHDPKWHEQLSLYSNAATFLAFRHGSQSHVRRLRAAVRSSETLPGRSRRR